MKVTIAIIGLFVTIFCSQQLPIMACGITDVYNKFDEYCISITTHANPSLCFSFNEIKETGKFHSWFHSDPVRFCVFPFLNEFCNTCNILPTWVPPPTNIL
ncbi:uncharacterized protein LOC108138469 [Drosophila elegans]|uniref:uncharacterized protein LOC108138469 n=1 Tax=Drosophila elegans TaxID=30023 RepID=UPI001BC84EFC|nr:uncharacterized protein LOC108138469 [Drosophila elegans]